MKGKLIIPSWNIEAMNGYTPITTFWQDFSIADSFGTSAVEDTCRRALNDWKSDYQYLTELSLVLNHKIWQHYEVNDELAQTYDRLWKEVDQYICNHLTGEALSYYYTITD